MSDFQLENLKVKNLQNLTQDEKQKFLESFDLIFCDCDGVVWRTMQQSIPGISKGIEFLRKSNKKFIFVTNNSIRHVEDHLHKFHENDIEVNKEDIIHPAQTTVDYLKQLKFDGLIYAISNQPFKDVLRNAGYDIIDGPNTVIEENFHDFYKNIIANHNVKAVVIDVDFNLSVVKLIRAQLYLKNNPDCILIGGASDSIIPLANTEIMGPGAFIHAIENVTKKTAIILGKPGKDLGVILKERFNIIDPQRVLFIGDSLEADISFAKRNGYQTLIVLTGLTKLKNLEENLIENEIPDYFIDSLANFNDFI